VSQWALVYWFIALCVFGVLCWVTDQAMPRRDRTRGWHVRRWLVAVWLALLWPGAAIVGVAWLFPVSRGYLIRFLER
jgi:hypothetical protein